MIRDNYPSALRGAAALLELLNLIGREGAVDADIAKIIVENEQALSDLARHAVHSISTEI